MKKRPKIGPSYTAYPYRWCERIYVLQELAAKKNESEQKKTIQLRPEKSGTKLVILRNAALVLSFEKQKQKSALPGKLLKLFLKRRAGRKPQRKNFGIKLFFRSSKTLKKLSILFISVARNLLEKGP